MKFLILISLLAAPFFLNGQNLIPNPGFDQLTNCPFDEAQIQYAPPWVSASNGTPDIFNECSTNQFYYLKVPNAGRWPDSYQLPKSGSGFAGILVYTNSNGFAGGEYLETPLKQTLEKGKTYYIEFYVSPDVTPISYWGFTDAVGLALTDTFYYKDLYPTQTLPLSAAIENRGTFINDTSSWARVSGCYTAHGGEKYATIGNFRSISETNVEMINPTYPFNSYFYVEDVSIQVYDPLPDTLLLCAGKTKLLNAGILDASYHWNTGDTDSTLTVQNSGFYTVEANMKNCILKDSAHVLEIDEKGGLPKDTTICMGESLNLTAPVPGSCQWSNGSLANKIEVNEAGVYTLTVNNECGQFTYNTAVHIRDCNCNIYIPNAFSPYSDGLNKELEVFANCDYPFHIKQFSIFDRWGSELYNINNETKIKWDGYYKGKPMPEGVYVWVLKYEILKNGITEQFIKSGDTSILK